MILNQAVKKEIVAEVKKVLPKNWKATFRIVDCVLVCTIREMPKADFLAMAYDSEIECIKKAKESGFNDKNIISYFIKDFIWKEKAEKLDEVYLTFNISARDTQWNYNNISLLDKEKERTKILLPIIEALNSQRDGSSFGYYVKLWFGDWKKPCKLI